MGVSGLARFFHVPESDYGLSACYAVNLWILFLLPAEFDKTHCCSLVNRQLSVSVVLITVLHADLKTFIISLFLYCHDTVSTFCIGLDFL